MEVDATKLSTADAYKLLTSVIVPRPIAWVTTTDGAGCTNLAPFSYFNGLCSDPPMLTLGIAERNGAIKDSLRIMRETGVLCVNLVERSLAEEMNASSAYYPAGQSEAETLGVELAPCVAVPTHRVAASPVALECKLVDEHVYGREQKTHLVVCEVVHAYLADDVLKRPDAPVADPERLKPIARLGGVAYAELGPRFFLSRPKP